MKINLFNLNVFISKIKEFFQKWKKKKRFYLGIFLILLVLFFIFKPKVNDLVSIDTVKLIDLENSVSASGEIVSKLNLNLSFNSSGIVKDIFVKVGDKVKKGQVLALLDNGLVYGELQNARGALKKMEANYEKLINGASNEEIRLAEIALENALIDLENTKKQQDVLVKNAKQKLLSENLEANSIQYFSNLTNPITISGLYTSENEGKYIVNIYSSGSGLAFSLSGLSTGGGIVSANKVPFGEDGLFINFSSDFSISSGLNWIVNVPNKSGSTYLTNLNNYNASLDTRTNAIALQEAEVKIKEAELAVKKAKPRNFEIDFAEAEVISALGKVQSAQASYDNTIIKAPASLIVTKVNLELGEIAEIKKEAISLEDIDNLYLEANINEANIVKLKLGQEVSFTTDSFGPSVFFSGEIIHIDPSATINEGIVNYKIKIAIDNLNKDIRSGMNADLKILIDKKEKVLVVPRLAIINRLDKNFVRIITNEKTKDYTEKEVMLGMEGDGNLVEVKSGLSLGDKIGILNK